MNSSVILFAFPASPELVCVKADLLERVAVQNFALFACRDLSFWK